MRAGLACINHLLLYEVPEESLGSGVHTSGGLIHEHSRGATHQGNSHTQLTLVTAAVTVTYAVSVLTQAQSVEEVVDHAFQMFCWYAS